MRKSTLLWLLLAAFCGTSLFHTSQKVHKAQEKLLEINKVVFKEKETIHVLKAEWSYLNQPARLEKLAKKHLPLTTLTGQHFIKINDIPFRGEKTLKKENLEIVEIRKKPSYSLLKKTVVKKKDKKKTNRFADLMKSLRGD